MQRIDLIIDALEKAKDGWQSFDEYEKALAAARELKELKPVAWCVRRTTIDGDVLDGLWTCDSDEDGAIPVYALDEVKHD